MGDAARHATSDLHLLRVVDLGLQLTVIGDVVDQHQDVGDISGVWKQRGRHGQIAMTAPNLYLNEVAHAGSARLSDFRPERCELGQRCLGQRRQLVEAFVVDRPGEDLRGRTIPPANVGLRDRPR